MKGNSIKVKGKIQARGLAGPPVYVNLAMRAWRKRGRRISEDYSTAKRKVSEAMGEVGDTIKK